MPEFGNRLSIPAEDHLEELPSPLRIDTRAVDGALVIGVDGEVDMLSTPELWAAVEQGFRTAQGRALVIDLSEVRFLDSHGLASLAHAAETAHRCDTRLRVVVGSRQSARRYIELCGLDRILALRETISDALTG